jgi:hypothetical protein
VQVPTVEIIKSSKAAPLFRFRQQAEKTDSAHQHGETVVDALPQLDIGIRV